MQAHFEYPSGIAQDDIMAFLVSNGIHGTWFEWNLNVFGSYDFTQEQYTLLSHLCQTGFQVKGIPVRGFMIPPPPPKLQRSHRVI